VDGVGCDEEGEEEELEGCEGGVCGYQEGGCCSRDEDGAPEVFEERGHVCFFAVIGLMLVGLRVAGWISVVDLRDFVGLIVGGLEMLYWYINRQI